MLIEEIQKSKSPCVMGILNVTPDSFSDGGRFFTLDKAVEHALDMERQGADIIDIGGESTRPNADIISEQEELDRVIPVIETLKSALSIPISIDSYKPKVMELAIAAGASMVNDVYALTQPGAMDVLAELNVPVCMMHMQGNPRTMQQQPSYNDVIKDISEFFSERIYAAVDAGIDKQNIIIDPGFGFGKTVEHNLMLIKQLDSFKQQFNLPILIGVSRKSTIGKLLGDKLAEQRQFGSLALEVIAATKGATIIRTHAVKAVVEAMRVVEAYMEAK